MSTIFDSIIVGAGLAGLTAAAKLAQEGRDVLVLERHSEIGGRARTDDLGGWLFNQGGHALYRNGVGHRTLRDLGVEPSGEIPTLAGAQAVLNGATTPLPIDLKGLVRTKTMGVRAKAQFATLMTALSRLDATKYASVTVDEWLRPYRADVQEALKAMVRLSTYSDASDIMSADAAISQLTASSEGVLYLNGGWAVLCQQIASATRKRARISTGTTVRNVNQIGGQFHVATDGGEFRSRTLIVAAGGPRFTAGLLGFDTDVFGPVGPAAKAAVLDLALPGMPTKHRFMLGVDEPTYFAVHSPPTKLAPEGKVAAVAMRYLGPGDDGSADAHRTSLEHIAELAGASNADHSRFLGSMTVTHAIPLASAGGIKGRPSVEVPGMPGAFIAGDWVGDRGLLADASIASGFHAATLL